MKRIGLDTNPVFRTANKHSEQLYVAYSYAWYSTLYSSLNARRHCNTLRGSHSKPQSRRLSLPFRLHASVQNTLTGRQTLAGTMITVPLRMLRRAVDAKAPRQATTTRKRASNPLYIYYPTKASTVAHGTHYRTHLRRLDVDHPRRQRPPPGITT